MMTPKGRKSRVTGQAITRRQFVAGAGAAVTAAVSGPLILTPGKAKASEQLVVTSWGGAYRQAVETNWIQPFTKETGIPITVIDNSDLAKVKAQVMSGNIEWDVIDATGSQATAGSKDGLWEPIDRSLFDVADLSMPLSPDYVPVYAGAGVVAWDAKRHPDGQHPTDYKEFWDAKTFPGRRGLRTRVSETLEMALLADGVKPAELYPLDVERGFKSLDRIKPFVRKWIETTPQTVSLVESGEIDFSYTYIGRVEAARQTGSTVTYSIKATMSYPEYLTVVKKTRNREAAMKFVAFCTRPDRQAALADAFYYTPSSRKAVALMRPEISKTMSSIMKSPNHVLGNDLWWRDRFVELQKRFLEWQLS
jgi:putative spermidine/putrescine transport system substrate-binding protein